MLLFFLSACQQADVKINDISNSRFSYLQKKLNQPILLSDNTVVFDSRPQYDYMMYSVPGAIHLLWEQLVANPKVDNAIVKGDKAFYAARRLARLGVQPDSEVVILGKDELGQASAGRLAWSLLTLGFKNIQVTSLKSMSKSVSPFKQRKHKSTKVWKPNVNYQFEVSKEEFLASMMKNDPNLIILDVRSEKEFKSINIKSFKDMYPQFRSQFIPWTRFYKASGRPNRNLTKELFGLKISYDNEIIVISNNGVRSGSVSYALLAMGFKNVKNFSSGFKSLLNRN